MCLFLLALFNKLASVLVPNDKKCLNDHSDVLYVKSYTCTI